jgi:hypothetical protein
MIEDFQPSQGRVKGTGSDFDTTSQGGHCIIDAFQVKGKYKFCVRAADFFGAMLATSCGWIGWISSYWC